MLQSKPKISRKSAVIMARQSGSSRNNDWERDESNAGRAQRGDHYDRGQVWLQQKKEKMARQKELQAQLERRKEFLTQTDPNQVDMRMFVSHPFQAMHTPRQPTAQMASKMASQQPTSSAASGKVAKAKPQVLSGPAPPLPSAAPQPHACAMALAKALPSRAVYTFKPQPVQVRAGAACAGTTKSMGSPPAPASPYSLPCLHCPYTELAPSNRCRGGCHHARSDENGI